MRAVQGIRRGTLTGAAVVSGALMVLAACPSSSAAADAVPQQRLGLWSNDMTMNGRHIVSKVCVDAAFQARNNAFSSSVRAKNCKSRSVTHNPDGSWTSVSVCEFMPGQVTTTRNQVTGDFNSKVVMRMTREPSTTPETTITLTWLGPCPAGQKGGDMTLENGMVVHTMQSPAQP